MTNPRRYGAPPFAVAVVHGGPGAPGEMEPVARELSSEVGVLEPLQTADTVEGQVEELGALLREHGDLPVTVVGFSWGAWLSVFVAARFPALVRKLVLVGTPPFDPELAKGIQATRIARLDESERSELEGLMGILQGGVESERSKVFERLGALFSKADAYDPMPEGCDPAGEFQVELHERVWKGAAELRRRGRLIEVGRTIQCPVVAIHGDFDPHPAAGVRDPLNSLIDGFRFVLLACCGHKPWIEKAAKGEFFRRLREEIPQ